jgi:hypothetical protein
MSRLFQPFVLAAMLFVFAWPAHAQTRDPRTPPAQTNQACPPYFYADGRTAAIYTVEFNPERFKTDNPKESRFGIFRLGGGFYTTAAITHFPVPFLTDANFLCYDGRVYYWNTSDLLTHPLSINPKAGLLLWLPSPADIEAGKKGRGQFSMTQTISHTAEIYLNPLGVAHMMPGQLLGPGKLTITVKEYDGDKLVLEWRGALSTYYVVHEDKGRSIKFYEWSISPNKLLVALKAK